MREEPAGQDDLLLVAAGQRRDRRVGRGGLDVEELDVLVGDLVGLGLGEGLEEAAEHLGREDDVLADGERPDDAVALAVLGQVGDALLHGVERLGDLDVLAGLLDGAAGDVVGAEDGAHALGATGAEKTGEARDLALLDVEVEGVDGGVALEAGRLVDHLVGVGAGVGLVVALDVGHVVHLLAEHGGDEVDARHLLDLVLADQLAVAHDGDAVADLIDLVEEVRDEDDADAAVLELAHHAEELLDLGLVERRGGLVEDEDLAVHVHGARDGDHLLHGDRAAAELLLGAHGDAEVLQDLVGVGVHLLPVGDLGVAAADVHVLSDGEVGAERDLLVHGGDAHVLRVLRGLDGDRAVVALEVDVAAVLLVDAGQDLDERGLARAVLAHEGVDLARAKREVDVLQGLHAREVLADAPHLNEVVLFHR